MQDLVLSTLDGGVLTVTLNRPDKRNALSLELIGALKRAVEAAGSNDAMRVFVLAGAGPSFCAGMDLKGVIDDAAAMAEMLHTLAETSGLIRRLPVPSIARVNGAAIGGGCGLAAVTDFAFSHPEARLGYPEVDLGLCPAVVAPWLIRKIGAGRARALLLAGGTMTGEAAHAVGLVDTLLSRDELESGTAEAASRFARGGRAAQAVTKRWLNELDGSLDDVVLRRAASLSAQVIAGKEAQERLRLLFGS